MSSGISATKSSLRLDDSICRPVIFVWGPPCDDIGTVGRSFHLCIHSRRLLGSRCCCVAHETIHAKLYEVGQGASGLSTGPQKKCTRFQMVVLSAYEQIRATRFDVLNDVDEDGYERAFRSIRPGMNVCVDACGH